MKILIGDFLEDGECPLPRKYTARLVLQDEMELDVLRKILEHCVGKFHLTDDQYPLGKSLVHADKEGIKYDLQIVVDPR